MKPLGLATVTPDREVNPRLEYVAQLWSALPIRQAAVRRAQLDAAAQKFSAKQRQADEERQANILAADYPDGIVVRVEYSTNVPSYEQEFARYWQNRAADLWKQDTFLVTAGGRYAPREVGVAGGAGGEFKLVFPRQVNGEPVISLTDKSFSLEFQSPAIQQLPSERVLLEFKLKDMILHGRPVF
jgi:hypothetical protein